MNDIFRISMCWIAIILLIAMGLAIADIEQQKAAAAEPVVLDVTIQRVTPDTYRIWWYDHGKQVVEERQGVSEALNTARRALLRDVTAP